MAGRSLIPDTSDSSEPPTDNYAFIECDPGFLGRCTLGVRTATHTYGRWLGDDGRAIGEAWGFFDFHEDPLQQRNLLEFGEQTELADQLHRLVEKLHADISWLSVRSKKDASPIV